MYAFSMVNEMGHTDMTDGQATERTDSKITICPLSGAYNQHPFFSNHVCNANNQFHLHHSTQ